MGGLSRRGVWKKFSAALLGLLVARAGGVVQAQNSSPRAVARAKNRAAPRGETHAHEQLMALLRKKIKYVFVIYQENRSFDSYFGTFPGANGLFTKDARHTPGFDQGILTLDGRTAMIHPFRIGPRETRCGTVSACFAADTDDIDHSHPGILAKMDLRQNGSARMDNFALGEEKRHSPDGKPSLEARQFGELAMAYEDCDTVPLLWQYAHKFVLFDQIFQEMTGPSTPGNLSIIGAQSGVTQWVLHPGEAYSGDGASGPGVPMLDDADPFWGSDLDKTPPAEKMPVNPRDAARGSTANPQINLTFATLPLTLQGGDLDAVTKADRDPDGDLADIKKDVGFITALRKASLGFGWYEEGYDKEPTDQGGPTDANGTHASYLTHHNGPQYFGYISNNPRMSEQLHGLDDFFKAVDHKTLPPQGGLFFVKGGYRNILGLRPTDPDANVQRSFLGDDDHPAYSDAQISEALVAETINKIAASPYWSESAIIVTWDDSEGDYDHVPPPIRARGPDGSPISDGPRVPLLLLSPYGRTNYVAHEEGSHASVVKFVDTLFDLPPLALLPDELRARSLGEAKYHQKGLGPQDARTPGVTDLTSAFSLRRLEGTEAPLSLGYVEVPGTEVRNLPQATGFGCKDIGIVPTDRARHIRNEIPSDFNPRPRTDPTPGR